MKTIGVAVALCGILASGTAWAEDAAIAPINQFVDALNAGDVKKAAATHVANAPIIDEFAPHHWTSLAGWLKGFMADSKMNKITDVHVTLQHATTSTVGAREAYEVVPNVITAKADGKPNEEKGIFTFALIKTAGCWKIAPWAWAKQ